MNNFYSNDVPPYNGKIYKFLNIENIFLKFLAKKKISKHTTFLMAISDAYTQKTLFLVGKYSFEEQKFEGKYIHICELLTVNFEEQLKYAHFIGSIYSKH